ncbi:MAG TPA: diaminopimelate epimerase [Gemmatimonadetes bacterium]|nr:diaminopimelate epimerase [Gemmatimonadota bacterium]
MRESANDPISPVWRFSNSLSTVTLSERDTPSAGSAFFKGHGLGNDYLVFEDGDDWVLDPGRIVAVCDRWRGPGSDGIVLLESRTEQPFPLRMFNPDGSEFERSGNGLRILAAYLAREGLVNDEPFDVCVGGDTVQLHVLAPPERGLYDVSAEMGRAGHGPGAVGLDAAALDVDQRLDLGDAGSHVIHPVSIGNPHAVVFPAEWSPELIDQIGPEISGHPAFADGTNVQVARVLDEGTLQARIWERGVGPTSASGTSACAVAAAAVNSGRAAPGRFEVRMDGGSMQIDVTEGMEITLTGPVQEVSGGTLTKGFLEFLVLKSSRA